MILCSEAATVLDQAARHVTEVDVMPESTMARGVKFGDSGHSVRAAILHAFSDCYLLDSWEGKSGNPHGAVIAEFVADHAGVRQQNKVLMLARWADQLGDMSIDDVARRDIRRDDLDQWARGRPSAEVADAFREAANALRSRPETAGLGNDISCPLDVFTEDDIPGLLAEFLAPSNPFDGLPQGFMQLPGGAIGGMIAGGSIEEIIEKLRRSFGA